MNIKNTIFTAFVCCAALFAPLSFAIAEPYQFFTDGSEHAEIPDQPVSADISQRLNKIGGGYKPRKAIAITGDKGIIYVIVEWEKHFDKLDSVEFYKLVRLKSGNVDLEWVRTIGTNLHVAIVKPTGKNIFPNQAPIVVVDDARGGSAPGGEQLHLIQLKQNTVDVIPSDMGRVVDIEDLDNDGTYEVVVSELDVPFIFKRVKNNFIPVCKDFPEIYRRFSTRLLNNIDKYAPPFNWNYFLSAARSYAQIGEIDQAQKIYERMKEDMRHRNSSVKDFKWAQEYTEKYIEEAAKRPKFSCALKETEARVNDTK